MAVLKTIITVMFIIVSVVLTTIILMQEGKNQGLGSLGGQASSNDSYWSRNKGRSREGILVKVTTALVVLFFVFSIVLNIGSF